METFSTVNHRLVVNCEELLEELQQCRALNEELTKGITLYKEKNDNWDRERKRYEQMIYSLRTEYPLTLLSQVREEQLHFLTGMMGRFEGLAAKRAVMRDTIRDIHDLINDDVYFDQ